MVELYVFFLLPFDSRHSRTKQKLSTLKTLRITLTVSGLHCGI